MEGILVLVRHGESQWNAKNIWTGLTDIGLSDKGKEEARQAASGVADISFDRAYTSTLIRAKDTLTIMLNVLGKSNLPIEVTSAINERDYGVYTGKNKLEIKKILGGAEFLKLRRGWDYPITRGESLKQVYERVIPYFDAYIAPLLLKGQRILIVAHGNSLRALIKKLDNVSDADIASVELATGEIVVYRFDALGNVLAREKRLVGNLKR